VPYVSEDGSHWYDRRTGQPVDVVPMKTRPGEVKVPTAKDAREYGLLPGCTSVTRMLKEGGLDRWIIDQHIKAALRLTRAPGEADNEFAKRIVVEARDYSEKAANFGSRMHSNIELYLKDKWGIGEGYTVSDDTLPSDWPYLWEVQKWLDAHEIRPEDEGSPMGLEFSFANAEYGYGARVDCRGMIDIGEGTRRRAYIDWKTQATTPGKPFNHWPGHGMQLISHLRGASTEETEEKDKDTVLLNILISSTEPGRIEPFLWLDQDRQWEGFRHCLGLYYMYGPGKALKSDLDSLEMDEVDAT